MNNANSIHLFIHPFNVQQSIQILFQPKWQPHGSHRCEIWEEMEGDAEKRPTFCFGCMEALKEEWAQKSQRSHGAKLQKRSRGLRGRWQTLMETLVDTYQTPPTQWRSEGEPTRSERGTVGHSFRHLMLIPVTPKIMNNTPKPNSTCVEGESKHETPKYLSRGCFWPIEFYLVQPVKVERLSKGNLNEGKELRGECTCYYLPVFHNRVLIFLMIFFAPSPAVEGSN